MKKFIFSRRCTSEEAMHLSLLIGNRKGNTLTIIKGSDKVIGCRVDEKDEKDVYNFARKHNLIGNQNENMDITQDGIPLPTPIFS